MNPMMKVRLVSLCIACPSADREPGSELNRSAKDGLTFTSQIDSRRWAQRRAQQPIRHSILVRRSLENLPVHHRLVDAAGTAAPQGGSAIRWPQYSLGK
jgi:uncharacterized protein (DUF2336 family)